MNIGLCRSCGNAYDAEEVNDGFCLNCAPDAGDLEEPELDMSKLVGDCE